MPLRDSTSSCTVCHDVSCSTLRLTSSRRCSEYHALCYVVSLCYSKMQFSSGLVRIWTLLLIFPTDFGWKRFKLETIDWHLLSRYDAIIFLLKKENRSSPLWLLASELRSVPLPFVLLFQGRSMYFRQMSCIRWKSFFVCWGSRGGSHRSRYLIQWLPSPGIRTSQ